MLLRVFMPYIIDLILRMSRFQPIGRSLHVVRPQTKKEKRAAVPRWWDGGSGYGVKGFRRYRGLLLLRASPKTVLAGNVSFFGVGFVPFVGISLSEGEGASYCIPISYLYLSKPPG